MPEWVNLPPHGYPVRIDPSDIRALHMMAWRAVRRTDCRNRDFWELTYRLLAPDWAVDVGVNYEAAAGSRHELSFLVDPMWSGRSTMAHKQTSRQILSTSFFLHGVMK